MSEIIPKEKILKNVRKGLVVPSPNPFPKLELETNVFCVETPAFEGYPFEAFLSQPNTFFQACTSKFEFLHFLKKLSDQKGWKEPVCFESALTELLNDNGMKTQVGNPSENTPLLSSCHKIISYPGQFVFDTRFQLLRRIVSSPVIVLVAFTSQIKTGEAERNHLGTNALENFTKAHIDAHYLAQKESYLFLINDTI